MLVDIELYQILQELDDKTLRFLSNVFDCYVYAFEPDVDEKIEFISDEEQWQYEKAVSIYNDIKAEMKERTDRELCF